MNNTKQLTYVEDFHIDLSSADSLKSYATQVTDGVLRGLRGCEVKNDAYAYAGIVGANSKYLFLHNNSSFWRYDGDKLVHLILKIPITNPVSDETRYEIYRDIVYLAFDNDGVVRFDENASTITQRWAFYNHAQDIAVVNERIVMLTDGGLSLRFAECGDRLYSDVELRNGKDPAPTIALPTVAQAICRGGSNTLYVLGDTCYKVTFSANEQDIKLNQIASGLGKVVRTSVAQVGGKILFATSGGMRCLNNDSITPVFDDLSNVILSFDSVRARAWRGRYALTVPYDGGYRTYLLNPYDGKCSAMLWNDVLDPTTYGDNDCVLDYNGALMYVSDSKYAPARFVRTGVNFGTNGNKYLRRLNIATKYDIELRIKYDNGITDIYSIKGDNKTQSLKIYGKSRAFDIEISSQGQMEVSALSLVAEAYKEDYYGN